MLTGKFSSRLKLRRFFFLFLAVIPFISGLLFYSEWNSWVAETHDIMERDGETVLMMIEESLERALKLLNATRPKLSEELLLKDQAGQCDAILRSSTKEFSLKDSDAQFGNLLLLNASGRLIAQSGPSSVGRLDFSDRFYYTDLKQNPLKTYTVSYLRIAQTTGKPVFHIAIPLRNNMQGFEGVLALQINAQRISDQLRQILRNPVERIVIKMTDGRIIFQYPVYPMPETTTHGTGADTVRERDMNGNADIITLPLDPLGLSTRVLLPKNEMFHGYFQRNALIILITLVAVTLVLLFFRGLFVQAGNLQKAIQDATTDENTGLRNRRFLMDELPRLLSHAHRVNSPLSVLFIDIDHFKDFNDLYGHDLGDQVLCHVGLCINSLTRRPLDCCCRWGGEEFVMVLPDTGTEESVKVARELMECVGRITFKEQQKTPSDPITISIGITTTEHCSHPTPNQLIKIADKAMFQAKREGRNRIVIL